VTSKGKHLSYPLTLPVSYTIRSCHQWSSYVSAPGANNHNGRPYKKL